MRQTTCCIAGGGPAGLVMGLLLARAGIDVTVLEKHRDFLRDFRGDTVHPTTLELLDDLGLGDRFHALPYSKIDQVALPVSDELSRIGDIAALRGKFNYIAMVPQWDLLDLLADSAATEPNFHLLMETEATDLLRDNRKVTGVRYRTRDGETGDIQADLTVACDGRTSTLRSAAGMRAREWPVPFDVWWFRLPRHESEPKAVVPLISQPRPTILINRGDYWQCASIISKGADSDLRRRPVGDMLRHIANGPGAWLADRVDALASWDEVKLLDVRLDRLRRWHRDGLLCIGDAAHAMSPIGGVGINLAVQDAVAAANLLAEPLRQRRATPRALARVRRRRLPATVIVQGMQRFLHDRALRPVLAGDVDISRKLPLPFKLLRRFPRLQRIPAFLVARGFRPERAPGFARREPEPLKASQKRSMKA